MAYNAISSLRKASAIANGDDKEDLTCISDWLINIPNIIKSSSSTSSTSTTEPKFLEASNVPSFETVWTSLYRISKSSSSIIQLTFITSIMHISQETFLQYNEQSIRYNKRYHYYSDLQKHKLITLYYQQFIQQYSKQILEILFLFMIHNSETQIRITAVDCLEYIICSILLSISDTTKDTTSMQPAKLITDFYSILFDTLLNLQSPIKKVDNAAGQDTSSFSLLIRSTIFDSLNDNSTNGSLYSQYHEACLLSIRALFSGCLLTIEQYSDKTTNNSLAINNILTLLYNLIDYKIDIESMESPTLSQSSTRTTINSLTILSYIDNYSKVSMIDSIREATYHTIETIMNVLHELSIGEPIVAIPEQRNRITTIILNTLIVIGQGLDDIHIRVRFAACTCIRTTIQKFPQYVQQYFLIFLPRLCFTRYFGPDRQRMYCVDTWRQLISFLQKQEQSSVNNSDSTPLSSPTNAIIKSPVSTVTNIVHRSISPSAGPSHTTESTIIAEQVLLQNEISTVEEDTQTNLSVRSSSPIQRVLDRAMTPPRTVIPKSTTNYDIDNKTDKSPTLVSKNSHHSLTLPSSSSPGLSIAAVAALAPGAEQNSSIGPKLVARYIEPIVTYYKSALKINYTYIQEAACHCIAELATKIDPIAVSPHAASLIEALLEVYDNSMKDLSSMNNLDMNPSSATFTSLEWNVRDAAIIALGKMYVSHADGNAQVLALLPKILGLLFQSLFDPIRAIREHTSMIFGLYTASLLPVPGSTNSIGSPSTSTTISSPNNTAITNSSPNSSEKIDILSMHLKSRSEKTDSRFNPSVSYSPTVQILNKIYYYCIKTGLSGNVPELRKIIDDLEPLFILNNITISLEDKQGIITSYYSNVNRQYIPSKIAIYEGSMYLYREYCACIPDHAATLLENLADTAADTQATAPQVQELLWRIVPLCILSLGIKRIKSYLDILLVPLGNCLLNNTINNVSPIRSTTTNNSIHNSGSTSTSESTTVTTTSNSEYTTMDNRSRIWYATDCLRQLANLIGVSIFRARITSLFPPTQANILLNLLTGLSSR